MAFMLFLDTGGLLPYTHPLKLYQYLKRRKVMVLSVVKWRTPAAFIICIAVLMLVTAGCNKKESDSLPSLTPEAEKAVPAQKESKASKPATDPGKVLVEVDGKKFTEGDADAEINKSLAMYMGQIPEDQLGQIREKMLKQTVDDFVTRTLLTQAAVKQGVKVSDAEINVEIDKIKATLPQGMTLEKALGESGITEDKLRSEIRFSLEIKKAVEARNPDKKVLSDKEIEDYYTANKKMFEVPETVHARHVLIKTEEKDDQKTKDAKKAKAEDLQKKIKGGADFASVAKESSDCPSKAKGGDLGTFQRGQMVKPFEDAAFSQEINAISPVVETKFGYHIIQVLEHNQPKTKSLSEAKGAIAQDLEQKKLQEAAAKYIAELKSKANIVYAEGFAPAKQ